MRGHERAWSNREGGERPGVCRVPMRAPCWCSADIVGAQIRIVDVWARTPAKRYKNYTPGWHMFRSQECSTAIKDYILIPKKTFLAFLSYSFAVEIKKRSRNCDVTSVPITLHFNAVFEKQLQTLPIQPNCGIPTNAITPLSIIFPSCGDGLTLLRFLRA